MRSSLCVLLLLGAANSGCSWTRYDDIVENSPIALLNRPKEIPGGFGSSLATGRVKDEVTLLVGGGALSSGASEFALGAADAPSLDARDSGHCMGGPTPCYFSNSPVALNGASSPGMKRDLCFVDGAGTASGDVGIVVRCTDDVEYTLDMPAVAFELLDFSLDFGQPTLFRFGADRGPDPGLMATADEESAVWYYPPLSRDFVELPNWADSRQRWTKKVPRNLTIARVADGRLLAVAEPEAGTVRLFFAPEGTDPSYIGCLGGTAGFGRSFATGPVLADDSDDELVIADDSLVYVFDGAKLAALPPTTAADCTLGALPEGTLITSFTCGSTKNISGCESSEFGAALGVGDLDGDGDGEVVVGAPTMTVRHVDRAGAAVIYDVEPPKGGDSDELFRLKDIAFLSSAEEDDQLGRSIALPELDGRHLLAAGAPGGNKVALFYCPSFLPEELAGPRCQ
jgi:hypothetical protein